MSAVASLFRNDYDAEGFRTCSVTGLDIHRSVENYVKLFGLTAVIALAVGGSFAFSVAMTRWEFIGLLDPSSYYTHLSIHAWNLLIFWMVFMEIAVLYVGGPVRWCSVERSRFVGSRPLGGAPWSPARSA